MTVCDPVKSDMNYFKTQRLSGTALCLINGIYLVTRVLLKRRPFINISDTRYHEFIRG